MCYMNLSTSSFSTFSRMRLWVLLLFAVSLLHLREAKGTRVTVFKQKGDDLLLNVDVPEDYLLVAWKFNTTVDLVRFPTGREPIVFPNFTGRIEFVKNFSVKLKNLQKTDSGLYTAQVLNSEGDQELTEYEVTVQEATPNPNLVIATCSSIVLLVGLVVLVVLVRKFLDLQKRRNYPREIQESKENTVYDIPEVAVSLQQMNQSTTDEDPGPTSTYSLVGPQPGSPETRDPAQPGSLYAQEDKPARSTNN